MFTSGSNHVRALRALKAKKIVGATYFTGAINDVFANYFKEAGFDVLGMEGIKVEFDKVQELSAEQVYAFIKQTFLKHRKADAIYLLGTGWRVLPVIDLLERDLGVPVVHPVPARCWEIQLRLSIREPVPGFGRLLGGDGAGIAAPSGRLFRRLGRDQPLRQRRPLVRSFLISVVSCCRRHPLQLQAGFDQPAAELRIVERARRSRRSSAA